VADHRPGRAGQLHPQGRRPLVLGDRQLGPRATRVVALLAPALLTALVLVDTVTSGQRLVVDARMAAAGAAMLLRAPLLVSLGVAVATTALVRLLSF
jgi:hypothetical protein